MAGDARLIVLGSGTAVPRRGRATSCYLLEPGGDEALLVDIGPGALHRAAEQGCDLSRLAAVLVTHLHPDHCADLVALQFALKNPALPPPARPVAVLGHPELARLVARLREAWPGWLDAPESRLRLLPAAPGPLAEGLPQGLAGRAFAIAHHATSLGYRLTLADGFTVAFSGDATESDALVELGRDADLFVLEAAAPDDRPIPGHLTPRRAGRIAQAAGARHLLLTHFYPLVLGEPIVERAREAFEGRVTLAEDGLSLPLAR